MRLALEEAAAAEAEGEVPIGAVIVHNNEVIARGHNRSINDRDPTAHAEIVALRRCALRLDNHRLSECTLYVTVEPCAMCAGAIVHVRLRRVIFGCPDPRSGAAGGTLNLLQMPGLNHQCEIGSGVLAAECAALLQSFFQARRRADIPDA